MPREYRPDAIEIFNTKGPDGDGFINIHMPIEMAKKLAIFNPAVAKRFKRSYRSL